MNLEYSFYRIKVSRSREGTVPAEDYRQIIRQHASEGWRFEQLVQFDTHQPQHIDIIFSKERSLS